jgi:hypothetical protein
VKVTNRSNLNSDLSSDLNINFAKSHYNVSITKCDAISTLAPPVVFENASSAYENVTAVYDNVSPDYRLLTITSLVIGMTTFW